MKTATESVYQSRIPTRPRTPKSVKSDMLNCPVPSSGTPRSTLPNAAPNRIARSTLDTANTKSQADCHSVSGMWPPTSIEMPRSTNDHSTSHNAR